MEVDLKLLLTCTSALISYYKENDNHKKDLVKLKNTIQEMIDGEQNKQAGMPRLQSAEEILTKHTGAAGIYLTKGEVRGSDALDAMEEYSNQLNNHLYQQNEMLKDEIRHLKALLIDHSKISPPKSEAEVEYQIEDIVKLIYHNHLTVKTGTEQLSRLLSAPSKPHLSDEEIINIAFEFGYGCDPSKGNKQAEAIHDAFVAGMKKYRELAPSKGKYSEEDMVKLLEWIILQPEEDERTTNEWVKKFLEAPESSNTTKK